MSWREKINIIPTGYSEAIYDSRKYSVTRTDFNEGKSIKVYAEELGGNNFISFNYYLTRKTDLLKPCEMPESAVIHFLENFVTGQK